MEKQTITFDQLPQYVCDLGRKVDNLTTLLSTFSHTPTDEVGGIELAREVTRLSAARIYTLVSKRLIPHKKKGNRLTFRRAELLAWLDEGNRQQEGGKVA